MIFYLGTHKTGWLGRVDIPLCVSYSRLRTRLGPRARLPVASAPWILDSGAFTVVSSGRDFEAAGVYAANVRRIADAVGSMEWCAPQDWMCEPEVLAVTRLTVADHQRLTLHSYMDLLEEGAPVIPVLQGWTVDDYQRHADMYEDCGFALADLPTVGVGSVCKRQSTGIIEAIFTSLSRRGYRLHGFGVKRDGLRRYGHALTSADSLAWSFGAVRRPPLPGCVHAHCQNCLVYALRWRAALLSNAPHQQLSLGVPA